MAHRELNWNTYDGLKIFTQVWEPEGSTKAVINILHGLGEHSGRYAHVAKTFNQAGYSVIASDLRGHGKTEGKRGHAPSFEAFMKDIDVLLEESSRLYPHLPQFLWGHSLGGVLVPNYVLLRKPQLEGVVITAPPFYSPVTNQKVKVMMAKIAGALMPEVSMASGLKAEWISRDPEVVSRYVNDPLVHGVATLAMAKYTLEALPWAFKLAHEWALPMLIMHGEADKLSFVSGSKELASKIPGNCTLKIWPGLWHEIHNEPEKDEVLAYALGWLDSQLSL